MGRGTFTSSWTVDEDAVVRNAMQKWVMANKDQIPQDVMDEYQRDTDEWFSMTLEERDDEGAKPLLSDYVEYEMRQDPEFAYKVISTLPEPDYKVGETVQTVQPHGPTGFFSDVMFAMGKTGFSVGMAMATSGVLAGVAGGTTDVALNGALQNIVDLGANEFTQRLTDAGDPVTQEDSNYTVEELADLAKMFEDQFKVIEPTVTSELEPANVEPDPGEIIEPTLPEQDETNDTAVAGAEPTATEPEPAGDTVLGETVDAGGDTVLGDTTTPGGEGGELTATEQVVKGMIEAIDAEQDPELRAALEGELASYAEGTGTDVDAVREKSGLTGEQDQIVQDTGTDTPTEDTTADATPEETTPEEEQNDNTILGDIITAGTTLLGGGGEGTTDTTDTTQTDTTTPDETQAAEQDATDTTTPVPSEGETVDTGTGEQTPDVPGTGDTASGEPGEGDTSGEEGDQAAEEENDFDWESLLSLIGLFGATPNPVGYKEPTIKGAENRRTAFGGGRNDTLLGGTLKYKKRNTTTLGE